jgi:hypothetical protein
MVSLNVVDVLMTGGGAAVASSVDGNLLETVAKPLMGEVVNLRFHGLVLVIQRLHRVSAVALLALLVLCVRACV